MNSRILKGYWIWGQFDAEATNLITSLYRKINNKLNGPNFDIHLTISGPFNYDEKKQEEIFRVLSSKFNEIDLQLKGISKTDEFFRSLFIDVAQNENLNNLKDYIDKNFNINSLEYCPHISLLYGKEDDATKNKLIRKLQVPKSVIVDKISIVKVDEEIKSWEVLKSYSLFKLKQ